MGIYQASRQSKQTNIHTHGWYIHNIIFNIYNNKALNIFPYPWLLASFQLFCGSVWIIKFKSKVDENDLDFFSDYLQNEILKSFGEIRGLYLRLPYHSNWNMKFDKGGKLPRSFFLWKAEFRRDLHSCVILGARSCIDKFSPPQEPDPDSRPMPDCDMKMWIIWMISCIIAACARHYLIQATVKRLKSIDSVAVLDKSRQGRLVMNNMQIEELRTFDMQKVDMPDEDVVGSGGIDNGDVQGFGESKKI